MKEEREAFIRENEERMARRKAYIRSLEQDIGGCEVKRRVGVWVGDDTESGVSTKGCFVSVC